ncbi:MAG: hypothetical protein V4580_19700 [Bacteroidota bacterium]
MKTLSILLLSLFSSVLLSQSDLDFHLNKAQKLMDEENYSEAVHSLSKALEYKKEINNSYKIASLYLTRGICKQKLKKYSEAEADMNMALNVSPEYLKAFDSKNSVYFESRQFDKIITNSSKALELNPKDTKFLEWMSQAYIEKREYDNALIYTDSILNFIPDDISTLRLKGSILHRQKKYEPAIAIENLILANKPNDPGALLNRSINYAYIKEYEKAENDNNFAAKVDTSLLYVAYNNTAYFIKLKMKDYKGAIELFDKCLALKPDFAYAYSNRAFCKSQLDDVSGALKDIQKSLDLDPNNSYAFKNYAIIKLKQNKKSEACSYLKKANEKGYSIEYDEEVNDLLKANCN